MKVRVARKEAASLFEQIRMVDLRGPEAVEDVAEAVTVSSETVVHNPARPPDTSVQDDAPRELAERRSLRGKLRDAVSEMGVVAFVLVLLLIAIPLQVPRLLRANLRKCRFCRKHDLAFAPIWPDVPLPAYKIDSIGALKIFVYTDDHPPPHFHVVTDRYNARFSITSCAFLGAKGRYARRHERLIRSWHGHNSELLAAAWAKTRPSTMSPR